MNKALEALAKSIDAQVKALVENGQAIYDTDNRYYFITGIRYDSEDNLIKFDLLEEK